jgi:hypothetical protein
MGERVNKIENERDVVGGRRTNRECGHDDAERCVNGRRLSRAGVKRTRARATGHLLWKNLRR